MPALDQLYKILTEKEKQKAATKKYFESSDIVVTNGIQADSAAKLVLTAYEFKENGESISLVFNDKSIEMNSTQIITGLKIFPGATVRLRVFETDHAKAQSIINSLKVILTNGLMGSARISGGIANRAMITSFSKMPGGIDFNPNNMQMRIKKDGQGVGLHLSPSMIAIVKSGAFEGLDFKIQSIVPISNLPMLLGLESVKQEAQSAGV